ncbi:MAG: putative adenylate-forming enzyme [Akkermansiaceae bacterium]|jgi:putative adenylate-forming enzyme
MKNPLQLFRLLSAYLAQGRLDSHLTPQNLPHHQNKKLTRHLRHIWKTSPYYQAKVPFADRANLAAYPLMDKARMMTNLSELNTAGLDHDELMAFALKAEETRNFDLLFKGQKNKFTVGLSTGTSGHRGLFLASEKESPQWAGRILKKALPSSLFTPTKIALFLRANSSLYEETGKGKSRIQFRFFDLFAPFPENLDALIDFQPDLLLAPASVLREITRSQKITPTTLPLKKIISVAEVLPEETQTELTAFFNQTIHQIYQATEGFLATTCSHGTLHLNEDLIHIEKEWLDQKAGIFIPIITDFHRTTQPIIRYRLNDTLVLKSSPCPCGSPLTPLAKIIGREDDLLQLPNKNGQLITIYPDLLCRLIARSKTTLQDYRMISQNSKLTLQITPNELPQQTAIQQTLQTYFHSQNLAPIQITFTNYTPPKPGEKLRRVINLSSPEAAL